MSCAASCGLPSCPLLCGGLQQQQWQPGMGCLGSLVGAAVLIQSVQPDTRISQLSRCTTWLLLRSGAGPCVHTCQLDVSVMDAPAV